MSSDLAPIKRALGAKARLTAPWTGIKDYLSPFTTGILAQMHVADGIDGSRDLRGAFFSPLLLLPRFMEYVDAGILRLERANGVSLSAVCLSLCCARRRCCITSLNGAQFRRARVDCDACQTWRVCQHLCVPVCHAQCHCVPCLVLLAHRPLTVSLVPQIGLSLR